jgi:C1A family cysteine protease
MAMTNDDHFALLEAIRSVNANWMPGDTAMTDLAPEERRRRLGYAPGPGEPTLEDREAQARTRQLSAGALAPQPLPTSVDWRNYSGQNYVTSIKDQLSCGSCVAFGTAATLESRARIIQGLPVNAANGSALADLSEAQLFYCGNAIADPCGNGWNVPSALAFASATGVIPEACFPYTPGNQPCNSCSGWQVLVTKVGASHAITSVQDMKQWLSTSGPLVTCFNVYDDFYAYTSGVYVHATGQFEDGHCVSCVGYDDARQAWVCKNSWGTRWGAGGFFWIGYGQCGIDFTMWAVDTFTTIYASSPLPAPPHRHVAGH